MSSQGVRFRIPPCDTKNFINTGLTNTGGQIYPAGEGCMEMHMRKICCVRLVDFEVYCKYCGTSRTRGWLAIFGPACDDCCLQ